MLMYFLKKIERWLKIHQNWHLTLLVSTWLVLQVMCFWYFGALTSFDSALYIENAQNLLQGKLPEERAFFYVSYSLVIAGLLWCKINVLWVVLLQACVALLALIALYKLAKQYAKNLLTPFFTAVLYVLWFKFYQWNLIVYTDALFTDMVIISVYATVRADTHLKYGLAFFCVLFTVFIRPVGILFLIALLVYFLTKLIDTLQIKRRQVMYLGFLFLIGCVSLLNSVLMYFIPSILESYANAEVIYPNKNIWIEKPIVVHFPDTRLPSLLRWLLFMIYQPWYMFKLTLLKLLLFLGHVKPYYSWQHNLGISVFLYPVYFFAVKAILLRYKTRFVIFMITFVGLQTVMVALSSENWDGRFLLSVLPWIFVLASFGCFESNKLLAVET